MLEFANGRDHRRWCSECPRISGDSGKSDVYSSAAAATASAKSSCGMMRGESSNGEHSDIACARV